jgi:hypothetical protein
VLGVGRGNEKQSRAKRCYHGDNPHPNSATFFTDMHFTLHAALDSMRM